MRVQPSGNNDIGTRQRDINLLWNLYNRRAMTTEQILRNHEFTRWYLYKKLREMEQKGYLNSAYTRNYAGRERRGKYYQIGERGLDELRRLGYEIEYTADQLRVRRDYLPYLLSVNDLFLDLSTHGWELVDSRDVKRAYSLNRGDTLHGILKSPTNEEYALIMFLGKLSEKNLKKIQSQLAYYTFKDMLLITRSEESFYQLIDRLNDSQSVLRYTSFRVLPHRYSRFYLPAYDERNSIMNYVRDCYGVDAIEGDKPFSDYFELVLHNGVEKYFVNLTDNDLRKFYEIKSYRRDFYEKEQRPLLILTHMLNLHKDLFEHIHHIDFLEVDNEDFLNYSP